MEDVSGLSEDSFLTPSTSQKDEAAKTEEVERTGGKVKEPDLHLLNQLIQIIQKLSTWPVLISERANLSLKFGNRFWQKETASFTCGGCSSSRSIGESSRSSSCCGGTIP